MKTNNNHTANRIAKRINNKIWQKLNNKFNAGFSDETLSKIETQIWDLGTQPILNQVKTQTGNQIKSRF